jgi:archaeosine-15-forming tRNA-guanine transglycosylase
MNLNQHYPSNHLNKKLSSTRSIVDSNQMNLLTKNNNGKEQNIISEGESRELVTVGNNDDIFIPTLNNTKRVQQSFQVLNEEEDENIVH